ncbi:hypothetical protein GCM10010964_05020 [Caldovatus sediminis]|uniref:Uncharacterized protein n=1 Tax=Caldovatus sediminis TaxID=2041189 RepID=A0A8J3EC77_9PROT|nr:hypothetical protein [Caldovatus sediminis]GGG19789.1 hypothetical protein GCM10010964_05020 [Caldovatus sediminis]
MLDIATFDAARGGNVLYKALAHPPAAEAIRGLYARLAAAGSTVAVYDPVGVAEALALLHPLEEALPLAGVYVQDVREAGARRLGRIARPVTELARSGARAVLVAAYDAGRIAAQAAPWMPPGATVAAPDDAALPPALRTNPRRVLDPLNFATNWAFFRDADGLSTRLVAANYWAGYGGHGVRLWLRLFDAGGHALATWEEALPNGPGGIAIDSRQVRARFGLPEFAGHLFLHAIGTAGHDVVKYVLHVLPRRDGATLSCTHDANPWPADRYAGFPAPRPDERVVVWLENAHPVPIPRGAIGLARMGRGEPVPLREAVPPFGVAALDVAELLPGVAWPAQLELFAGRHIVRPRYEVLRGDRRRIAHANVERTDLAPDPAIPGLGALMGRGFLLPFPVLDRERFRTLVQPTPMATGQADLPLAIEVFAPGGARLARRFLGRLPRDHAVALDLDELLDESALRGTGGHAELLYDFREGGEADGWLHALFRYEDRRSGHAAEASFGAHVYNTILTYKGEPQSYAGPPPGLSTRLFLGLGPAGYRSFAVLIHPTSVPRTAPSDTRLLLHDGAGAVIAETRLGIPASGSAVVRPDRLFAAAALARAGERGYVLVRDGTCRLFGYHGLLDEAGGRFSLDHMFGF